MGVAYQGYIGRVQLSHSLSREGGNVLFSDSLNTFYLRLYGVRHGKGPLG